MCLAYGVSAGGGMSELQNAIVRIDAAQLGGESLDDEPEYRAVELVTNTARRVANPDIKRAAAHVDAELGDRKGMRQDIPDDIWDELCATVAKVAVSAALGVTESAR